MKLWVDADACPGPIKEIVLKAAHRLSLTTLFVANKEIYLPLAPYLHAVRVGLGPDVVDAYIVAHAQAGDLVVTQDIPLAAQLVALGVEVLSVHGTLFTAATIGERLSVRNFMQDLRDSGTVTQGPKPFGDRDKRQFANAFDQMLTRLLKASSGNNDTLSTN